LKKITPIILAIVTIITIATIAFTSTSCGSPTTGNCPEMGIITSIDNPSAPCLTKDNRIGSVAPEFTWETIDCKSLEIVADKTTSLSDLKGKPIMIIFHKTMNCPGCKAQMPFILGSHDQLVNKDTLLLTIYRGDSMAAVKRFVASQGYTFLALADEKDEFAVRCGFPIGAPITIFVDANGIIKAEKIGPFQSQEEIKSILDSL